MAKPIVARATARILSGGTAAGLPGITILFVGSHALAESYGGAVPVFKVELPAARPAGLSAGADGRA